MRTMARRGMVASPNYLATQTGLDILRRGGSAIDAAIATNAAPISTKSGPSDLVVRNSRGLLGAER